MRIMQFPSLITREESTVRHLKNCNVVIDGQNFFHNMYEKSGINFLFSCESNEFAKYMKSQLAMFKKADVRCYIVLKGGDTDIEKKIEKFKKFVFDLDANDFVPPVLLKDTMAHTVQDMGLRHAYCVTESKNECVALAQKLGCPLISFDIEYCFRKSPYIPSVTLKFDKATNSIVCRQYKLEEFLQKHSMTEEKTVIFATLSDTTIFPQGFFESLLKTWGVSNDFLLTQYKQLIAWLSGHTEQQARDDISKALTNEGDENKFWFNYQRILNNMRQSDAGHTTDYLINSKLTIVRQDPAWFEKGVVSKHIPVIYVNLYKWRVIEGSWCTGTTNDLLMLSIEVIKYAYNLLTNFRGDTIKVYQDADSYMEIDCGDSNVRKPDYECNVTVFENGWDRVTSMKLFEHFLNVNNIDIAVLDKVPDDAAILFISLVYFARKKQMENQNVTTEVYAMLLSYVIINYVIDKSAYKRQKYNLREMDCSVASDVTARYFKSRNVENRKLFDVEPLQRMDELYYCLQHMNHLNTLCGKAYQPACYIKIHNGTFVYKVFCEARDMDCDDFLHKLLEKAPSVLLFVNKLVGAYKELLNHK